jgi:hypothetical protein
LPRTADPDHEWLLGGGLLVPPKVASGLLSNYTGIDIELDAEVVIADVVVDLEAKIPDSVIAFVHL